MPTTNPTTSIPRLRIPGFPEYLVDTRGEVWTVYSPTNPAPGIEYRDVDGYPGFKIANDGSVWSCWKVGDVSGPRKWAMTDEWRPRSPNIPKDGYHEIVVSRDKKRRRLQIHLLVLKAFRGPRPHGMVGRHLNGNKDDNRLENLLWGTHQENSDDKFLHGTAQLGVKHHQAKLTEEDIAKILELKAGGLGGKRIGKLLGRGQRTINDVLQGRTWSHLTGIVFLDTLKAVNVGDALGANGSQAAQ